MRRELVILFLGMVLIVSALGVEGATPGSTRGTGVVVQHGEQPDFQRYYRGDSLNTYWPVLANRDSCTAREDLLLQVTPAGCQPTVVRSDLLAEQNVPVFCQIDALKVNPFVDIKQIKNIRFTGSYPPEVVGSGFHPARAALRTRDRLLGSPLINNVGYVVVVLRQQPDESKLPEFVSVNLNARLEYDADNAFGIGRSEFILTPQDDAEWEREKVKQTFFNGNYAIRLDEANDNEARISIYSGDRRVDSVSVEKGKSEEVVLPGFYCRAGLDVRYDGFEVAQPKARLQVGDDVFDVFEGSKFSDGRCSVERIDINVIDDSGGVTIKCGSQRARLELGSKVSIRGGEDLISADNVLRIGEPFFGSNSAADVKQFLESLKGTEVCEAYIKNSPISHIPNGYYSILRKGIIKSGDWALHYRDDITKNYVNQEKLPEPVLRKGAEGETVSVSNMLEILGDEGLAFRNLKEELIAKCEGKTETLLEKDLGDVGNQYFADAIADYEQVVDELGSEKDPEKLEDISYGEKALGEAIRLSFDSKKEATEVRLIQKFLELYPDSTMTGIYMDRLNGIYTTDFSEASVSMDIDNDFKIVSLRSLTIPKRGEMSADFNLDGRSFTSLKVGEHKVFETFDGQTGTIILDSIRDVDSARVRVACPDDLRGREQEFELTESERSKAAAKILADFFIGLGDKAVRTARIGQSIDVCGRDLVLRDVNVAKAARVSLTPDLKTGGTETNLTVRVGIEKRAIKLSPDKTKERIDNLEKNIEKWKGISSKLGNVVKGLKGACFATAGVLTVKNFFAGLDGTSLAREQAMRGQDGWTRWCSNEVSRGGYGSLTECYNANAAKINQDVQSYAKAIAQSNDRIKGIESNHRESSGSLLGGDSLNVDGAAKDMRAALVSDFGDETVSVNGESVKVRELVTEDSYGNREISYQQMRDMYTNLAVRKNGQASAQGLKRADEELGVIGTNVRKNQEIYGEFNRARRLENIPAPVLLEVNDRNNLYTDVRAVSGHENKFNNNEITSVASVVVSAKGGKSGQIYDGGTYLLGLQKQQGNNYVVKEAVRIDSVTGDAKEKVVNIAEFQDTYNFGGVVAVDASSYSNKFLPGEAVVRYYEREPYKGLPAVVPFDRQNGWYAATREEGFGGIKAFESSGRPASFWVCNVGSDGRVDFFNGFGDDTCRQFNVNTGSLLDRFPGLSDSDSRNLVAQADRALRDAAGQYGKKLISINGESCSGSNRGSGNCFETGQPAASLPGTQCQDFMSPEDCLLLFNVCDPVICPSSRCDLGGTYHVADVIQTGIVGSALLCLPNAKEGIAVPVCLTGIQAGIDGYVSIMEQYQACLQESLDTGRTVGICDTIHSVYMCEFFWRQAAPVANVLLPKIVEFAYTGGQGGVRGGGEYLTVQSAWDNAQGSVDFFTKDYAANSIEAFRARSIEEAGTPICQAFVSVKGPKSFEALIEPDSPPQFHAWFSEIPFNDATVPATSQYKVFYHIFAGNDRGVSYSVYLKDPPESSFYRTSPTVGVAGGFVSRGNSESETRDFTAPVGYKQLCVRINDKEECGFTQVSTSFAINYLRDAAVKDELQRTDINSENECVSGSLNPSALLNPNIQEAGQEALDPAIYNRGVVRVCSTDNPGSSPTDARFVDVGHCGNEAVRCWLDKESVDSALSSAIPRGAGLKNETLQVLEQAQKDILIERGIVFSDQEALNVVDDFEQKVNKLRGLMGSDLKSAVDKLIEEIDDAFDKIFWNYQKAELLIDKGSSRGFVVRDVGEGLFRAKGGTDGPGSIGPGGLAPGDIERDPSLDSISESAIVLDETLRESIGKGVDEIEVIGIRYDSGLGNYEDRFAFRWNSDKNKPEVIVDILVGIVGIIPAGDGLANEWVDNPNEDRLFREGRGIDDNIKNNILEIMKATTKEDLIERVVRIHNSRTDTKLFFPDSSEIKDSGDSKLFKDIEEVDVPYEVETASSFIGLLENPFSLDGRFNYVVIRGSRSDVYFGSSGVYVKNHDRIAVSEGLSNDGDYVIGKIQLEDNVRVVKLNSDWKNFVRGENEVALLQRIEQGARVEVGSREITRFSGTESSSSAVGSKFRLDRNYDSDFPGGIYKISLNGEDTGLYIDGFKLKKSDYFRDSEIGTVRNGVIAIASLDKVTPEQKELNLAVINGREIEVRLGSDSSNSGQNGGDVSSRTGGLAPGDITLDN